MSRRRIAAGVVALTAVLPGGRGISILYDSFAWYDSLGARALWTERLEDTVIIGVAGLVVALVFAAANLGAAGRSVGGLTRPRRLANVEFGEVVPPAQLRLAGAAVSVAIALGMLPLLPSWQVLALARMGVDFREADPYFHHDLSFYVTWLPLERALHAWILALVVSVTAIVVALYVLTSGIRWNAGALRLGSRVRRHLGVLAALLLLVCTWGYRLDSYELLTSGGHDGAGFTFFDHQWMLPGFVALSLATVATALTVGISAWMGQLRTSLIAIMAAIGLAGVLNEVLPFVVERSMTPQALRAANAPYVATRADYTRRAFGADMDASGVAFTSLQELQQSALPGADSLVAPGATGMLLVDEPTLDIAAPSLGTGFARLAHAWAARKFGLLADSLRRRTRIVTVRDVRDRVQKLYPFFVVGPSLRPLFRADTLYWTEALFTSSASYPLADRREIWGEGATYFHRVGTALVNARTGRVNAAFDIPSEPVAAGWMKKFEPPGAARTARSIQHSLSISSAGLRSEEPAAGDTSFRARVIRLYDSMHAALSAGDLRRFGLAYDSLGALVGRVKK